MVTGRTKKTKQGHSADHDGWKLLLEEPFMQVTFQLRTEGWETGGHVPGRGKALHKGLEERTTQLTRDYVQESCRIRSVRSVPGARI